MLGPSNRGHLTWSGLLWIDGVGAREKVGNGWGEGPVGWAREHARTCAGQSARERGTREHGWANVCGRCGVQGKGWKWAGRRAGKGGNGWGEGRVARASVNERACADGVEVSRWLNLIFVMRSFIHHHHHHHHHHDLYVIRLCLFNLFVLPPDSFRPLASRV